MLSERPYHDVTPPLPSSSQVQLGKHKAALSEDEVDKGVASHVQVDDSLQLYYSAYMNELAQI